MNRKRASAFQCWRQRETSGRCSRHVLGALQKEWYSSLTLSDRFFQKVHRGSINALDLDRAENRYLLAGAADGSISVFDSWAVPDDSHAQQEDPALNNPSQLAFSSAQLAGGSTHEVRPVFVISKNSPGGHRFTVSAACWYPIDTGLFVSASYDETLRVWDTNTLEVVSNFKFPAKVTTMAMSSIATTHCLVAGASMSPQVRLCDPASGAFSHTLSGHQDSVWSVAWSMRSEFELLTGDAYGQIRVWDIRRSGTIRTLDQYCTAPKVPQPSSSPSTKHARKQYRRSTGSTAGGGAGGGGSGGRRSSSGSAGGGGSGAGSNKRVKISGIDSSKWPDAAGAPSGSGLCDTAVRAHHGRVTSLLPSPDGLYWISAGSDSRVRLWDGVSWHNKLTHFQDTINKAGHKRQLAISEEGRVFFHPCGNTVQIFDLISGHLLSTLSEGHYMPIGCSTLNPVTRELYTGGDDSQILTWRINPFGDPDENE